MPPLLDGVNEGDVEGYTLLSVVESALSSAWLDGVDVCLKPLTLPLLDGANEGDVEGFTILGVVESAAFFPSRS